MRQRIQHWIAQLIAMLLPMLLIARAASAAQFVGVKAGVIQFTEGEVFLDGNPLQSPQRSFSQMENGWSLRTGNGRAELLLSPNTYLRLGASSLLRLEQNQLEDTQLALEKGCALIEVIQEFKGNRVEIRLPAGVVEIRKVGLYRLDVESGELRVYGGAALATKANKTITVKKGRVVRLDDELASVRFDTSVADSLHKWAARRSFELFEATESTRKQQHWQLISMGWAHNSNYRMRFQSQRLYNEWAKSRQGQKVADPTQAAITAGTAAQQEAAAAAQAQAAVAAAQAAAAGQTAPSTPQPSR